MKGFISVVAIAIEFIGCSKVRGDLTYTVSVKQYPDGPPIAGAEISYSTYGEFNW